MATDITKSIESSLAELQKNAKEQKARIVSMNEFAENVYTLMLTTLIEVEKLHNEAYEEDPKIELEHSSITFNIANANEDGDIFSLISFVEIKNPPQKLDLTCMKNTFESKYHGIIEECNANHKVQNFKISGMEISTFSNQLTMLITNNKCLTSSISDKATEPNIITFSLNLEEE